MSVFLMSGMNFAVALQTILWLGLFPGDKDRAYINWNYSLTENFTVFCTPGVLKIRLRYIMLIKD